MWQIRKRGMFVPGCGDMRVLTARNAPRCTEMASLGWPSRCYCSRWSTGIAHSCITHVCATKATTLRA